MWKAILLIAVLGLSLIDGLVRAPAARAIGDGSTTMMGLGFDTCENPTAAELSAWWPKTPWRWFGVYVGGVEMACPQPNLDARWLEDVHAMGWQLLPIWVGPQAPCSTFPTRFSSDPAAAYQQGKDEGASARKRLVDLGFANSARGTSIVYDLEASGSSCDDANRAFVQGWTDQLHTPPGQVAGVYGSTCGSSLQSFANGRPPPDFIWGAVYDGDPNTGVMPCVAPDAWSSGRRHKQFSDNNDETWNGLTLSIDRNCAGGPMSPGGRNIGAPC